MREKYIEERFPRWFKANGSDPTDVEDPSGTVAWSVPSAVADRMITARDAYVNALVGVFMADDDLLVHVGPRPSPTRPPRPTEGAPFIKLCLDGAVVAWLSAAELVRAEPADLEARTNADPSFLSWITASRRFDAAIGKLGFRAPEHLMAVGMSLSAFRFGYKLHTETNGFPIKRDLSEPWRLWDDLRVNVERVG